MSSSSRPPKRKADDITTTQQEETKEETKELKSDAKPRLIRDLPPLHQHIALHSGLKETDPADKKITRDLMIAGLIALGETEAEAIETATNVFRLAFLKGLGTEFTVEQAIKLMHPNYHTGNYNPDGSLNEDALLEMKTYTVRAQDSDELILPTPMLNDYRAARFKENPKPGCCLFRPIVERVAHGASDKEFDALKRLYPDPKRMKLAGERPLSWAEIEAFYRTPYVIGNARIEYVAELRKNAPVNAPALKAAV